MTMWHLLVNYPPKIYISKLVNSLSIIRQYIENQQTTTINRRDCYSFSFNLADREDYDGVTANYWDDKDKEQPGGGSVTITVDDKESYNVKTLNHTYQNKANATRAAKNHLKKLQRAAASFDVKLAQPAPWLIAGLLVQVNGFNKAIDSTNWRLIRATHQVSATDGFTSTLNLERFFYDNKA